MRSFGDALRAELRHLSKDRWDLAGITLVPGVLLFLIGAMFWHGAMRHLPIVVIDDDKSVASRTLVRALEASPMVRVAGQRETEREAVRVVRAGEAVGFINLPNGLGAAIARHRTPVIRISYNASFLSAGSQLARGSEAAVQEATTAIISEQLSSHDVLPSRVRRLAIEVIPLTNAANSFEWFLGTLLFPAILHLVTAVTCAMALGREMEQESLARWTASHGSLGLALLGKMAPYVGSASLWGVGWLFYITLARGWRVEGSLLTVVVGQSLFFMATAAISALLVAATREAASALSICAVYAGSALAYAGATLPLSGASAFASTWSKLLPLSYYVALQMGQFGGQELLAAVRPTLALFIYVLIAGGMAVALIARQARAR